MKGPGQYRRFGQTAAVFVVPDPDGGNVVEVTTETELAARPFESLRLGAGALSDLVTATPLARGGAGDLAHAAHVVVNTDAQLTKQALLAPGEEAARLVCAQHLVEAVFVDAGFGVG